MPSLVLYCFGIFFCLIGFGFMVFWFCFLFWEREREKKLRVGREVGEDLGVEEEKEYDQNR